jgi:hypothetical protein
MILVSNSEQNLQTLINRERNFFDFVNIKLNSNKCEVMTINPHKGDTNIIINDAMKE